MATTRGRFIESCMEIVNAKPVYKNGQSSKTECDCIGMVKYGLRQNGVSISTTGTNWSFRNDVTNIRKITSAKVLKVGDVVFKMKQPGESGYRLPAKYQKGGSGYNGDLNDYNHIGVVKSVSPLRIIHMTSPTAKTDSAIGKWKYAADLKAKYLEPVLPVEPVKAEDPVPASDTDSMGITVRATVTAENGKPVKLRQKADTNCRMYDLVPVGTEVIVNSYKDDWCMVSYGSRKKWFMMTKFLEFG